MLYKKLGIRFFKVELVLVLIALAATTATHVAPVTYAAGAWANGQTATVVLGQNNFTSTIPGTTDSTMRCPFGVTIDPTTGKVFVAESDCGTGNNRILRFSSVNARLSGSAAEAVLGQADFTGSAANRGGSVAANTLSSPYQMTVDSEGRLWVADWSNHRVLRFDNASTKSNGADADGVLGQVDFVHNLANRGGTVGAGTLSSPTGVWVDAVGRLWVADSGNSRVLRFDNAKSKANGADADGVLGQSDLSHNDGARTQSGMYAPYGVVVSKSGTLFVSDYGNDRVLRFDNATTKPNGSNADGLLGQADFTSIVAGCTQSRMSNSLYVAFEEDGGRLYVSDNNNSRILIFDNTVSKANGANADHVLGQPNFTTCTPNTNGLSASTLNTMGGVFFDNVANVLWVADLDNSRVLRYSPTWNMLLPIILK